MPEDTQTRAAEPARAPSTVRTVPDLAQVMVDQWGHRGEFTRGQVIDLGQLDSAHYDREHAVRVGAVRMLTEAEARAWGPGSSPTSPTLDDGSLDLDHQRAMQFGAGISPDLGRTVTTGQGPAEPAEFAKPTLPGPTGEANQPAARPVVVVDSAAEAETEGARAARIVATPSGPAFESADERAAREEPESAPSRGRRRASESTADEG